MSCWVVPSVASELWKVPVEKIIAAVRFGELPSRTENGFTFVDVAPHSVDSQPAPRPKSLRPITYKVVRPTPDRDSIPLPRPTDVNLEAEPVESGSESTTESTIESTGAMGDWRRGRSAASIRRTPPSRSA